MAVSTDFQKLRSTLKVTAYDVDPNATSATDVGWVDFRDYESLLVQFFRTVGTSDLTLAILGNTAADGSGTDATIKTITLAAQPDAVGDTAYAEVSAQEVAQAGADEGLDIQGVSASVTFDTGTDEAVVTYIGLGKRCHLNQTADVVA